jgi:hypothetical protein
MSNLWITKKEYTKLAIGHLLAIWQDLCFGQFHYPKIEVLQITQVWQKLTL